MKYVWLRLPKIAEAEKHLAEGKEPSWDGKMWWEILGRWKVEGADGELGRGHRSTSVVEGNSIRTRSHCSTRENRKNIMLLTWPAMVVMLFILLTVCPPSDSCLINTECWLHFTWWHSPASLIRSFCLHQRRHVQHCHQVCCYHGWITRIGRLLTWSLAGRCHAMYIGPAPGSP